MRNSPTHPPTHSLSHSLTQPVCFLAHSLARSFVCSFAHTNARAPRGWSIDPRRYSHTATLIGDRMVVTHGLAVHRAMSFHHITSHHITCHAMPCFDITSHHTTPHAKPNLILIPSHTPCSHITCHPMPGQCQAIIRPSTSSFCLLPTLHSSAGQESLDPVQSLQAGHCCSLVAMAHCV